jgi:hypothetical protein
MTFAPTNRPGRRLPRKVKRFSLPIGLRLSLAFLVIILLTGLIGILAIQQFSSLTNITTELNAHDLPEAITLVHLRSLLYRQRDLERSLLGGSSLSQVQSSTPAQQGTTSAAGTNAIAIVPLDTPGPTPAATTPDAQSRQAQQLLSDLAVVLKEIAGDRQRLLAFEHLTQGSAVKDLPLVQRADLRAYPGPLSYWPGKALKMCQT